MPAPLCGALISQATHVVRSWKIWVIAHSAGVLNGGAATLLNRATGGLSSPDISLAHPSLVDKAEWTVGEDFGSDHLSITIELLYQNPL